MELVDLEFKREGHSWFLRLFIDKPGGVTLDDCAEVSREISALLEVEDPIEAPYRLEVSSPGIDRPLKKPADFDRFAGQLVKIKTRKLLDPDVRGHQRKTFVGELCGLDGTLVRLRQTDRRGGEISIPLAEIDRANLEPKF
jgi:ribosome maturation factor RimP